MTSGTFISADSLPIRERQIPLQLSDPRAVVSNPDSVIMFSGGADSLCAAIESVHEQHLKPILVSHRSAPPVNARQRDLRRELRQHSPQWSFPRLSFWIHRKGGEDMFLRHQELNDAVLPVDQFAARTAETLTAMLNRQGEAVVDAVSDMIKRYSSELAQNVLPNDCLLRIVVAPSEEGFQKQQGDVFAVHHAGSSWAVTYQGITRNSPNSKGIRTIARLLRHPGQEFHVLDLANDLPLDHAPADWQSLRGHSLAEIDGDGLSVHRSIVGSADEILDPQARREYQ